MFRRAYVRGVNQALIDLGAVKYANEELAAQVADSVGDQLTDQPLEAVAPTDTAAIADNLLALADSLQESAQHAEAAAQTVGGEQKLSALIRKLSEEASTGSTILGTGTSPNTESNATQGEAKMDNKDRPEGYANTGMGNQAAAGTGTVGAEGKVDGKGMGPSVAGTNSTTEVVKSATIRRILRKLAEGTTAMGDTSNTVTDAAAVTGEGAMDAQNRPEGYAVAGVGNSELAAAARAAAVGIETEHPKQEEHAAGTNSVIEQAKSAEDKAYLNQFNSVLNKYAAYLPKTWNDSAKVAAVQYLIGLTPGEREATVNQIRKTAGEIPEGLKDYVEKKVEKEDGEGAEHEKKETKEEEKKEEAKEEEKKEDKEEKKASASSIISRLRNLQR